MTQILSSRYVSRTVIREFLRRLAGSVKLFGPRPQDGLLRTRFLSIQRSGRSQRDLLRLLDEVMREQYGFGIDDCGAVPDSYLYLDDGRFTGNKAIHDLRQWLPNARPGSKLIVVFYAIHTEGASYFTKRLQPALEARDVTLDLRRFVAYQNARSGDGPFDCLWPTEHEFDRVVANYVLRARATCRVNGWSDRLFRPCRAPSVDSLFTTREARDVVEGAILRAGCHIIASCRDPKGEMRPLGYEKLESLGFGSLFVTWRNISNNCPLPLWWGDPNKGMSSPLGRWYPLFPRRPNDMP